MRSYRWGLVWNDDEIVSSTGEADYRGGVDGRVMSEVNRKEPGYSSRQMADPEEVCRRLAPRQYWKDVMEALGTSIELAHQLIAEELPSDELFTEGAARQILVNAYERDRRARQLCIQHYGARCFVCGLSFEERYGPEAAGIIHVHHIIPLSGIGESYQVDPIKDLRPICPNCHAVIHATKPPRAIEQVVKMVRGG